MHSSFIQISISTICAIVAMAVQTELSFGNTLWGFAISSVVALIVAGVAYLIFWLLFTKTAIRFHLFHGFRIEGEWVEIIYKPIAGTNSKIVYSRVSVKYYPFFNKIEMSGESHLPNGAKDSSWTTRVASCEAIANDVRVSYVYQDDHNPRPTQIKYAAASIKFENGAKFTRPVQGYGAYQSSSDPRVTRPFLIIRMNREIKRLLEGAAKLHKEEAEKLIQKVASYYSPVGIKQLWALAENDFENLSNTNDRR